MRFFNRKPAAPSGNEPQPEVVERDFSVIRYDYDGNSIAFDQGEAWVNATEMAKPFGNHRRPFHFLRSEQAKAIMEALAAETAQNLCSLPEKADSSGFCLTVEGRNGGTWMHPDLALEFARWLSPEFGLWCNRRVRELLAGQYEQAVAASEQFRQGAYRLTPFPEFVRAYVKPKLGMQPAEIQRVLRSARELSRTYGLRFQRVDCEWGNVPAFPPKVLNEALELAYVDIAADRAEHDRTLAALGSVLDLLLKHKGDRTREFTPGELMQAADHLGLFAAELDRSTSRPARLSRFGKLLASLGNERIGTEFGPMLFGQRGRNRHRRYTITPIAEIERLERRGV